MLNVKNEDNNKVKCGLFESLRWTPYKIKPQTQTNNKSCNKRLLYILGLKKLLNIVKLITFKFKDFITTNI